MKAKLIFLAGLAVGYVLGTRAGRSSYEDIKASVKSLWAKDVVQETVTTVQHAIKDQAGEAARTFIQQARHSHSPEPKVKPSGGMAGTNHQGSYSHGYGAHPLDIVPEVSDEFPDAGMDGGEGQKRGRRRNPGSAGSGS